MKSYFRILGLSEGADQEKIKKAYRKLALKYHPDVNPSEEAKSRFIKIVEAYEFLTNPSKPPPKKRITKNDAEKIKDLIKKAAAHEEKKRKFERAKRIREKKEKEQARQYTLGFYTLIGILIAFFSIKSAYNWHYQLTIDRDPIVTVARVVGIGQKRMFYEFEVGGQIVEDEIYVSGSGMVMLADNGFPLKINDEFELVYNAEDPSYNQLNFEKVSPDVMNRYLFLTSNKLQEYYEEEWKDKSPSQKKTSADCLTLLLFDAFQFEGITKAFNHDNSIISDFTNNSMSWYFFKKKDKFLNLKLQCEGKAIEE